MNATLERNMDSQLDECRQVVIHRHGDEVFQELWIRCNQANRDWSVPQHGFIHHVARNISKDMYRRRACFESFIADVAQTDCDEVNDALPLKGICERERSERIRECIKSLPEPYSSAIAARYFAGLPVADIANSETVSSNAIKSRLRRARQMLKDDPVMQELAVA